MIVYSSKNPIVLNELFGFRRNKKSLNKDNKTTPVTINNFKQEYDEYLKRIPKLSSEERNKYKAFISKMLNDIEKVLNKILTKYPKVKDMFSISDLNYIVELNDMINFNEFIYVYLNEESKKDSYVNFYNNHILIGLFELEYAVDEEKFHYKNPKSYNDIYNDMVNDPEVKEQINQAISDIERDISKLGYGKVDIDISKYSGFIGITGITLSPKYKQYFK